MLDVFRSPLLLVCLLACAFAAAPAHAQTTAVGGIATPNLEWETLLPLDDGRANGGRLVGKYLYVTTGKSLIILDVSEPLSPTRVGKLDFDVLDLGYPVTGYQEDVDTDGEFLIRSEGSVTHVVDVRDPSKPSILGTVEGVSDHTVSCVLSCTYMYGSEGTIVDMRDPSKPVELDARWTDIVNVSSSHDVTEVAPGIVYTASEPMYILDARQNPAAPKVLAEIPAVGFVHGTLWPHNGTDPIALVGGEALGPTPACQDDPSSTFQTYDTRNWQKTKTFKLLDEYKLRAGDEGATAGVWCTHWANHHPSFGGAGLVNIAWYEQGTRLLQVNSDGKINQVGYFIPHGGSVWDQRWITDRVLYTFDHHRGIDILSYTGEIPEPAYKPSSTQPGTTPSGGGTQQPSGGGATQTPAKKPSFGSLVTLPKAKGCFTARKLAVKVRKADDPVTALTIKLGKKVAKKVSGAALNKAIKLKKLPKGKKFTLRVEATTKSGAKVAGSRSYRGCR
jgi:hypothetical protein